MQELFGLLCLSIILLASVLSVNVAASSKPFTIQHFTDDGGDLESTEPPRDSGCNEKGLRIPDIVGVSYSSDGEILNSTVWLDQPFIDPSRTNLTIYEIDVSNKSQVHSLKNPHISFQNNHTRLIDVIDGKNASLPFAFYEDNDGALMFLPKKKPIYYVLIFDTDRDSFKVLWPQARQTFNSFLKATVQDTKLPSSNLTETNIRDIQHSPDWIESTYRPLYSIARFIPSDPSWLFIKFGMTIQVITSPSFGKSDADYKYSLGWNWRTNEWETVLEELSGYGKNVTKQQTRIVYEKSANSQDFSNIAGGGSHVDLSVNLRDIGSPDNFAVFANAYSQFARYDKDGNKSASCFEIDNTNWVPLPPPKIDLTVIPSSLTLSPGEEKIIQVRANSSTSVPAKISFSPTSDPSVILKYTPPTLSLSSFGKGSSSLKVIAQDDLIGNLDTGREIPLHIIGIVDFPIGFVISSTGATYKSTHPENITTTAFAYISALTERERSLKQVSEIYNLASSSIKDFSLVVAAIVGIVTPITVILKRGSIKDATEKAEEKTAKVPSRQLADKKIYYAAAAITAIAGYLMIVRALLDISFDFAIAFLILGALQFSLMIPLLKRLKLGYYIGVMATIVFIIVGVKLGPVNEVLLIILGFQIAYVLLNVIIIVKERSRRIPVHS